MRCRSNLARRKPVKSILIAPLLGLAFLFPVTAQETGRAPAQPASQQLTPAQQEAATELNEATRSYLDGHFEDAELHAEKALALDPSNKTAPLFIARTLHAQYKPGDQSEANVAIARTAIGAYKRLLIQDPRSDEAYKAIAYLYGAVKDEELFREWVFRRAVDGSVSDDQRAEAYLVLASRDWDCSFKIIELPSNQTKTLRKRRVEIHYTRPKDPAEYEKAHRCATEGLEMIDAAITLAPNSEDAWTYKKELLLELAKLSEMDHDLQLRTEYTNQASGADRTAEELRSRKADSRPIKP